MSIVNFWIIFIIVQALIIEGYSVDFYSKIFYLIALMYNIPFSIISLIYTDEETLSQHCMEGLDPDFNNKCSEGDFIVAAEFATPENVNFMATFATSGERKVMISAPMTPPQKEENIATDRALPASPFWAMG